MYRFCESPLTLTDALRLKAEHGAAARFVAGGTDILVELAGHGGAGAKAGVGLIDLTRIAGLADIWEEDGALHLGPLVTHNQCVRSRLVVEGAFALARACWEVGAPQIRNRATVAGNLVTASPANDSIVPLMALDASVRVESAARGSRTLPLKRFFRGVRQVDLADDEMLTRITVPLQDPAPRGNFIKLGLRRAQAISILSVAGSVGCDGEDWDSAAVTHAAVALGAVAPTVVRATEAEEFLVGRRLTEETVVEAARLAAGQARPIDDLRGSADYRAAMVETLVARLLRQLRDGRERDGWLERPVTLWGDTEGRWPVSTGQDAAATVNGRAVELEGGMTLLDSLRAAGFVGVKEGCAEGECGACTVYLDGMAVMACLVPAERAAGSEVVTVEGLAGSSAESTELLHSVQQALIESGGVQCGYCTPGIVMSAAALLDERSNPNRLEAQEALTGNLCRCTGYRKILDAVVAAGRGATR
ncbi:MAG: 2Fe-2S iron-sulfur cluster binding domain-containing protein [Caldilineaceae bacterium SB0662_bin_25]|nr:2Fe-2S iron-sulfur cluster binding domain-containing protein [Caldilineaceae bacterium SB0662_bin_25]